MTDAPERIWAFYSNIFGAMWTGVKDEGADEYIRADLAKAHAGALLRKAAARASARWAARREHADRLAEMDYPEAAIDAKTVSAKADEAEMIADEILAIDPDAVAALDRYVLSDPRVEPLVEALERIESITVHSGGEIHGVTATHWKTAFVMARDEAEAALAAMRAIGGE